MFASRLLSNPDGNWVGSVSVLDATASVVVGKMIGIACGRTSRSFLSFNSRPGMRKRAGSCRWRLAGLVMSSKAQEGGSDETFREVSL
jgi:hypothetical protein